MLVRSVRIAGRSNEMTDKEKPAPEAQAGASPPPSNAEGNLARFTAALFVPLGMLVSLIWGLSFIPTIIYASASEAAPPALLIGCTAICLILLCIMPVGAARIAALSATVLVAFALIGVFGSNASVSTLVPIGENIVRSNHARWEVVALMSTGFMALVYMDALDEIKAGFAAGRGLRGSNVVIVLLAASAVFIWLALKNIDIYITHQLYILLVCVSFGAVDLYIWKMHCKNTDGSLCQPAENSRTTFILLDIPIFAGLAVLFLFALTLGCTDQDTIAALSDSLAELSNHPCVEGPPFLAGAIAFQMISFNLIYVLFTLEWHKIKNPSG